MLSSSSISCVSPKGFLGNFLIEKRGDGDVRPPVSLSLHCPHNWELFSLVPETASSSVKVMTTYLKPRGYEKSLFFPPESYLLHIWTLCPPSPLLQTKQYQILQLFLAADDSWSSNQSCSLNSFHLLHFHSKSSFPKRNTFCL